MIPLCHVPAIPQKVVINDIRLGALYYALQITILGLYIAFFINSRPWETIAVPTADFAFFGLANSSEFYRATLPQNKYVSCGNASYSYGDQFCRGSSSDSSCDSAATCDGLNCETNPQCTLMHFSELNIKGEEQMKFATIVKDYQKTTAKCGSNYDNYEIDQAYCNGLGLNFFKQEIPNEGNAQYCSCSKLQNLYPLGIEEVELNVKHKYFVSGIKYPQKPDGPKPREQHNRAEIMTHLCMGEFNPEAQPFENCCDPKDKIAIENGYSGNCKTKTRFETFSEKNRVKMKIGRWLELVGVKSLDERNNYEMGRSTNAFTEHSILPLRTTGLKIKLTFHYMSADAIHAGKMEPDQYGFSYKGTRVTCFVYAELVDSYQSFGSLVVYTSDLGNSNYHLKYPDRANNSAAVRLGASYPIIDPVDGSLIKSSFHDRYVRGIKFEFAADGKIGYVEGQTLSILLAATAVYFTFANYLIQFIISFGRCYACKHVYSVAQDDIVTVGREHAKVAAQAIVALNSFERIRNEMDADPDDPDHSINFDAIVHRLTRVGFKEDLAAELTQAIFDIYGKQRGGSMTFGEWADLVTHGETRVDAVLGHLNHSVETDPFAEDTAEFIEASHFVGRKKGYKFKNDGDQGSGYYLVRPGDADNNPVGFSFARGNRNPALVLPTPTSFKHVNRQAAQAQSPKWAAPPPVVKAVYEVQIEGAKDMSKGPNSTERHPHRWVPFGGAMQRTIADATAGGLTTVQFSQRGFDYVLDLQKLTQLNVHTGKIRKVRKTEATNATATMIPDPSKGPSQL